MIFVLLKKYIKRGNQEIQKVLVKNQQKSVVQSLMIILKNFMIEIHQDKFQNKDKNLNLVLKSNQNQILNLDQNHVHKVIKKC